MINSDQLPVPTQESTPVRRTTCSTDNPAIHQVDSTIYQWHSHALPSPAAPNHFRIGFVNVHGLQTKFNKLEFNLMEIVQSMMVRDVAILGISEHQLPLTNYHTRKTLHNCTSKIRNKFLFPYHHRLDNFKEAPEDSNGKQMGGTGILVTQEMVGRIEPKGLQGDSMGRWSMVHLRRKRNLAPITIISIQYNINIYFKVVGKLISATHRDE
jgi:hypothetical protein